MKILFLHGWQSVPGGVKPTFLAQHGHEVINPKLAERIRQRLARRKNIDVKKMFGGIVFFLSGNMLVGWDIIAPSAIPFGGKLPKVPREMTVQDIAEVQGAFAAAAKRAVAAGFEWLELHYAHGYLAHEFYSPLANQRTDSYGGKLENRMRFLLETFAAVRKVWPERFPLTVRLSVTDWIDGGVTVDDSVELVRRLKSAGLDLLDVSHGSITPDISHVPWGPGFMIPAANRIRREAGIPTAVGWQITEPQQAEDAIRDQHTDLVMLAREMLRDPYWPYHAALKLGDEKVASLLPVQYARAAQRR